MYDLTAITASVDGDGFLFRHKLEKVHTIVLRKVT